MKPRFSFSFKKTLARRFSCAALFLLVANLLLWTGCGGRNSNNTSIRTGTPAATTATTQVKIGDAPVDGVVAFELTVNSITLNPSNGTAPVSILSSPTPVEITHTSGTFEPLAVADIPSGTYSSATLTVANPEVVIINSLGQPEQLPQPTLTSNTATVNFTTPISVGITAAVLVFDLNLANSLFISGTQATVTPIFSVSLSTIGAQNQQEEENGEIEDVTGTITTVSGSSFTISVQQHATPLTFNIDANTQFKAPLANMASLQTGMVVEVDAVTQSSGALLATKVEAEVEVANGLELEGFVSSVTGNPATQFQVVVQEVATPITTAPLLGAITTADIASNTNFKIDDNHIDLSGLNFTFDVSSLKPGQRVEVDVEPPIATTPTAKKVILKRQALIGTISNLIATGTSTATFTLTVDPVFSAFALVSQQSTLTVFQQPGTELKNITALSNGQTVRVRGLVFFDTVSSSYRMVAGRITPP
jgi:hypothetical protein